MKNTFLFQHPHFFRKNIALILLSILILSLLPVQQTVSAQLPQSALSEPIYLKTGANYAYVEGNHFPLDLFSPNVFPYMKDSILYFPLNGLAEAFSLRLLHREDGGKTLIHPQGKVDIIPGKNTFILRKSQTVTDGWPVIRYIEEEKGPFSGEIQCTAETLYIPFDMISPLFGVKIIHDSASGVTALCPSGTNPPAPVWEKLKNDFSTAMLYSDQELAALRTPFIDETTWADATPQVSSACGSIEKGTEFFQGQTYAKIIAQTTKKPAANYYLRQKYPLTATVSEKDTALISFYARATEGTEPKLYVVVEESTQSSHYKSLAQEISLTSEWKRYDLPFEARLTHKPNNTSFYLAFGFDPQTVEVMNLQAASFEKKVSIKALPQYRISYPENESSIAWRKEKLLDIQKNRTKETEFRVIDETGMPISHALVEIETENQAFNFGTAAGQAYITETASGADAEANGFTAKENCQKFNETLSSSFNTIIPENALKWPLWVGRKENSRLCMRLLKERGFRVRGHVLYWDNWDYVPEDIRNQYGILENGVWRVTNPEGMQQAILQHIRNMAGEFRDQTVEWDVLNEPTQSRSNLFRELRYGEESEWIKAWFQTVRSADPDALLYINEMLISGEDAKQADNFQKILNGMLSSGVDFDGIGMQTHLPSVPPSPEEFSARIKAVTDLGKYAEITEYDMQNTGELTQADVLQDYLLAAFANPKVTGFNIWGHWDYDHWRRNSPFYRGDWSIKPAGQTWNRMRNVQLSTNVSGITDSKGYFRTNVLNGDYKITVSVNGIPQTYDEFLNNGKGSVLVYQYSRQKTVPFLMDFENQVPGQYVAADIQSTGRDNDEFKLPQWGGWISGNSQNWRISSSSSQHQGNVAELSLPPSVYNEIQYNTNLSGTILCSFAFCPVNAELSDRTHTLRLFSGKHQADILRLRRNSSGFCMEYYGLYPGESLPTWHWLTNLDSSKWYYPQIRIDSDKKNYSLYLRTDNHWEWKSVESEFGILPQDFNTLTKVSFSSSSGSQQERILLDDLCLSNLYDAPLLPISSNLPSDGMLPSNSGILRLTYPVTFTTDSIPTPDSLRISRITEGSSQEIPVSAHLKISANRILIQPEEGILPNSLYRIQFSGIKAPWGLIPADLLLSSGSAPLPIKKIRILQNGIPYTGGNTLQSNTPIEIKIQEFGAITSAAPRDYTVYAALYQENQLQETISFSQKVQGTEINLTFLPKTEDLSECTLKVFCWDNNTQRPLYFPVF